jgi:hypothetical protein
MPKLDTNNKLENNSHVSHRPAPFSEDTVKALQEFGQVLLRIHKRLVAEGKIIEVDAHYGKRNGDK